MVIKEMNLTEGKPRYERALGAKAGKSIHIILHFLLANRQKLLICLLDEGKLLGSQHDEEAGGLGGKAVQRERCWQKVMRPEYTKPMAMRGQEPLRACSFLSTFLQPVPDKSAAYPLLNRPLREFYPFLANWAFATASAGFPLRFLRHVLWHHCRHGIIEISSAVAVVCCML